MERPCLDRRCRPFVPYLRYSPYRRVVQCRPYNPCLRVVQCRLYSPCLRAVRGRLGVPGCQYPPFAPALPGLRADLAGQLVRAVRAVLAAPVLLAVALTGSRRRTSRPRINRYTVLFSFDSPPRCCWTWNAAFAAHGPDWGHYVRGATKRCPLLHNEVGEIRAGGVGFVGPRS